MQQKCFMLQRALWQSFGNECMACIQPNVESYMQSKTYNFQITYQIHTNYQIKRVNSKLFYIEFLMLLFLLNIFRQYNQLGLCYIYGDTTCRKHYQNEYMNETTITHYKDNCRQFKGIIKLNIRSTLTLITLLLL